MKKYPELTEKNIIDMAKEMLKTNYGKEKQIVHDVLERFPLNDDINTIAIKIAVIDVTHSTHLSQHKEKISLYELAEHISKIPNFDERVKEGRPELVSEIAKCNGKVNLFSFATKYCTCHNHELYGKDNYSIYDSIVKKMLPYYSKEVSAYRIDQWRKNFDYKSFHDCIGKLLENIHIDNPRRMFDYFMWYPNRKNQNLSEHNIAP